MDCLSCLEISRVNKELQFAFRITHSWFYMIRNCQAMKTHAWMCKECLSVLRFVSLKHTLSCSVRPLQVYYPTFLFFEVSMVTPTLLVHYTMLIIGTEKNDRVQNDLFSGIKQSTRCKFHETKKGIIYRFIVMLINIYVLEWKIGNVNDWLY